MMLLPANPLRMPMAQLEPWQFLYTMNGESFLWLYLGWFLFLWIGVLILRASNHDSLFVTAVGLLLFEGLGVARLMVGSAHGLRKWDYLFIMMFVGGCLFVVRSHHFEQGGSSGTSGCGGGGCGGGGCGGGGCGGCGS